VGPDKFYRLGALLLDLNDPGKVLHRTPDWLMHRRRTTRSRFYRGVCFPCGTVVIEGTLFVLLRRRDKYCAWRSCDFDDLLNQLCSCPP